ncbi:MAG: hypothetical protein AAFX79_06505 [Planctomycetota bacterium]
MLVELLRPAGSELARRWLACLLIAPERERAGIVEAIEQRMAATYGAAAEPGAPEDAAGDEAREMHVAHPPQQKDGYVEQVITTYTVEPKDEDDSQKPQADGEDQRPATDAG